MSIYLYIYISIYLYIYISIYLYIYTSVYLYIYVSKYLCIYISIYLFKLLFCVLYVDCCQFRVFPGFQSERYPSAFLVVRRLPLGRSVPRPLSMSPAGVANPVVGKFNPIITYFTTLRRDRGRAGTTSRVFFRTSIVPFHTVMRFICILYINAIREPLYLYKTPSLRTSPHSGETGDGTTSRIVFLNTSMVPFNSAIAFYMYTVH